MSIGVNQCIYQYLSYQAPFLYDSIQCYQCTLICICAIIGAQLIYASGFVYRKDIQYMLSQEHSAQVKDERIIQLPSAMYWLVYILGLVLLISVPYDATSALFPCCIGTLGIGGMLKYCFPALFKKIKERRLIADKLWLIALSNLYASLRRAVLLIEIYAISSSVMIAIMISQQENPREMITAIIGFIVVILLLLASILYKYTMEATTRHMFYYNLYKLGYTYRQLLSIIKKEVISFYVILIGLPLFYIGITLIRAFYIRELHYHSS